MYYNLYQKTLENLIELVSRDDLMTVNAEV